MGVSFTESEISEFQNKLRNFNALRWVYQKQKNNQEISDAVAEQELGRFGLYMLRVLALNGCLNTDVGSYAVSMSFADKIKKFIYDTFKINRK